LLRKFSIAVLAVLLVPGSAYAEPSYQAPTLVAAQEALVRLGYDIGDIDGAWGGKSREAMNALRAEHGLPPAEDFVGSSLWLVHRASPGQSTLPHPGEMILDLSSRRAEIAKSLQLKTLCSVKVGIGIRPNQAIIPDKVSPIASPRGFIEGPDDWYSAILEGVSEAQGKCVAGNKTYCKAIIDMAVNWADADALELAVSPTSPNSEDALWIGNLMLRDIAFAYSNAITFEPVDDITHARVLDWLKRRIDQYHHQNPGPAASVGDPNYLPASNHAMTIAMSSMVFGALVGDRSMMQPALDRWAVVMQAMREDGSLPNETKRGARWFHYSTMQLGQLLTTQQIAAHQGIELMPPPGAGSIQMGLGFLVSALADFDIANKYAVADIGGGETNDYSIPFIRKFHFGFLPAYRSAFGDDEVIAAMRQSTVDPAICSDKARRDEKMKECRDDPLSEPLAMLDALKMVGPEPDKSMAYPAGCFLGQTLYPLDIPS
jgi:Alginate lyase